MAVGKQSLHIITLSNILLLLLTSCNNASDYQIECTDPHCNLIIQPYDNFSHKTAENMAKTLKYNLEEQLGISVTDIKILPNKQLTDDLMNEQHTRYRANKILDSQKNLVTFHDVVIGVTDKDISTTSRGHADWGIQGLAYVGEQNCIVSTYRLSDKKSLWKLAIHEFQHSFMHARHCPNDDPTCLMQDGHGNPNWKIKSKFCNKCK